MRDHLVARYRVPQPRNALAEAIRTHACAAMDVSDGLVGDLGKLCAASGVSAEIVVGDLPFSPAAGTALKTYPLLREIMLTGGDDYEIVCTVPHPKLAAFRSAASAAGVPITAIGADRGRRRTAAISSTATAVRSILHGPRSVISDPRPAQ